MRDGHGHRAVARAAVSRAHRRDRPARAGDQLRSSSSTPMRSRSPRSWTPSESGQGARAAARHSGADQGQHRYRRQDAHDRRIARARRQHRRARFVRRRAAARGRRGDPRQDESQRVGELPLDAFVERMERARRTDAQSVRARSNAVRLELRFGIGDGRELLRASAIGTETDGSVTSPAAAAGLVGIKPTVGLISRAPASFRSRTVRTPPARWRARCATRRFCSARSPASIRATPRRARARGTVAADYTSALTKDGLRGARIGVARKRYTGYSAETDKVFAHGARSHAASTARRSSIPPTSRPRARRTTRNSICCCTSSRPTSTRISRSAEPNVEVQIARRRDRVQHEECVARAALLRAGDHGAGAEERAAHGEEVSRRAGEEPPADGRAGHRRDDRRSSSSTRSSRRRRGRRG